MVSLDSGQPAGAQAVRHLVYFCLADGRAGKWQKTDLTGMLPVIIHSL